MMEGCPPNKLVKCCDVSLQKFAFASPQLPCYHSKFTTPLIRQTSSLARQYPATKKPNDTTTVSLVNKPLHKSDPLNIQRLNDSEALQVLELCRARNYKIRPCKNVSRGCPVNSYFTITDLHEKFCPLNILVKMRSILKVEGNMNIFMTTSEKFRPFCKSFVKKFVVLFLYKKNSNDNGIKISVSGYTKRYKYEIRFFSKDYKIIHAIVGLTNSDIYRLPSQLIDTHGPLLGYQIRLDK
jgi:hypothetical protein